VRARAEPAVPPGALVEVAQHRQQLVGGGRDLRRQLGDALAELLEIRASSPWDLVTFLVHQFAHGHLTPPLIPLTYLQGPFWIPNIVWRNSFSGIGGVEVWRGGLGVACLLPALSAAGA
jgi:hypothetical protein